MASSSSGGPATALRNTEGAQKEWRKRETSKFLKNKTSAVDAVKDMAAATAAGARGCGDLSQIKADNHAARTLMNKLKKDNRWPDLYRDILDESTMEPTTC